MAGHLADAVHQLDLSATGCHYVATGITGDLADAQANQAKSDQMDAGPSLSPAQYDALEALSLGQGKLYESLQRGMGVTRVSNGNGTRVSIATYRALATRGLVMADNSTSLFHGQKITVTDHGQRALAQRRPAATPAASAMTAPKPPVMRGARR
ncbi:hypothetical protein [Streptomyces niveus]|uniref:hypothetical protein n=1 Tax=Streptomyces niveus TaxID=193462 RepID=UPI0036E208F2